MSEGTIPNGGSVDFWNGWKKLCRQAKRKIILEKKKHPSGLLDTVDVKFYV